MLSAIVLGGAACLQDDLAKARVLFTPELIVGTNHAARDHDGPVDHWVSMHPDLFPGWIAAREAAGRPPAGRYWTAIRRAQPAAVAALDLGTVENWGGSSGLLAVTVALSLGCRRIVCCGVPLEPKQAHYDDPKPWGDAGNYRRAWLSRLHLLGHVRSMSGWTRQILSAPTKEWFDEEAR